MTGPITVRDVVVDDRPLIIDLVRTAFEAPGHDSREEVDIVTGVWSTNAIPLGCELVATEHSAIIGHVLGSVGDLNGRPAIGIAPLCVEETARGRGVGSSLMDELLRRIESARWPLALILGDPQYYARFGFEPAGAYGMTYRPAGPGNPNFMVKWFVAPLQVSLSGSYRYSWELS
jgi:predicted N-acetyltransferase YhbS